MQNLQRNGQRAIPGAFPEGYLSHPKPTEGLSNGYLKTRRWRQLMSESQLNKLKLSQAQHRDIAFGTAYPTQSFLRQEMCEGFWETIEMPGARRASVGSVWVLPSKAILGLTGRVEGTSKTWNWKWMMYSLQKERLTRNLSKCVRGTAGNVSSTSNI